MRYEHDDPTELRDEINARSWRPIASAPRSGIEILAFCPKAEHCFEFVHWVDRAEHAPDQPGHEAGWMSRDGWNVYPEVRGATRFDMDPKGQPTHWMLLPEDPEGAWMD